MSDVGAITSQALDQSQVQVSTQIQTSVLKKSLDLEKEAAKMLLQSLGIGKNLDVQA
ncbi:MAG TPA: YjfB family protein [Planctomycetota bacterium]|nr:YjfB family protein [Planctomycetota bacterium]